MFDNLRATARQERATAQARVAQAVVQCDAEQARADQLAGLIPELEAGVAAAVAAAAGSNAALAEARSAVDARTAERNARQAERAAAEAAVHQHDADEPDALGPNGKPGPGRAAWVRELRRLQGLLAAAEQRLRDAQAALDLAGQAWAARSQDAAVAAGVIAEAQRRLDSALRDVAEARQIVEGLRRAVTALQQEVAVADGRLAALDAREARLVAEPLDRADLQHAADAELAGFLELRRRRRELLDRRATARAARAGQLAARDATADELAAVRAELAGWQELGRFPDLAEVAATLDELVEGSLARRTIPADSRDDDVALVTTRLAGAVQVVAGVLSRATAERDAAQARLDGLAAQLREHQEVGP